MDNSYFSKKEIVFWKQILITFQLTVRFPDLEFDDSQNIPVKIILITNVSQTYPNSFSGYDCFTQNKVKFL